MKLVRVMPSLLLISQLAKPPIPLQARLLCSNALQFLCGGGASGESAKEQVAQMKKNRGFEDRARERSAGRVLVLAGVTTLEFLACGAGEWRAMHERILRIAELEKTHEHSHTD